MSKDSLNNTTKKKNEDGILRKLWSFTIEAIRNPDKENEIASRLESYLIENSQNIGPDLLIRISSMLATMLEKQEMKDVLGCLEFAESMGIKSSTLLKRIYHVNKKIVTKNEDLMPNAFECLKRNSISPYNDSESITELYKNCNEIATINESSEELMSSIKRTGTLALCKNNPKEGKRFLEKQTCDFYHEGENLNILLDACYACVTSQNFNKNDLDKGFIEIVASLSHTADKTPQMRDKLQSIANAILKRKPEFKRDVNAIITPYGKIKPLRSNKREGINKMTENKEIQSGTKIEPRLRIDYMVQEIYRNETGQTTPYDKTTGACIGKEYLAFKEDYLNKVKSGEIQNEELSKLLTKDKPSMIEQILSSDKYTQEEKERAKELAREITRNKAAVLAGYPEMKGDPSIFNLANLYNRECEKGQEAFSSNSPSFLNLGIPDNAKDILTSDKYTQEEKDKVIGLAADYVYYSMMPNDNGCKSPPDFLIMQEINVMHDREFPRDDFSQYISGREQHPMGVGSMRLLQQTKTPISCRDRINAIRNRNYTNPTTLTQEEIIKYKMADKTPSK